MTKKDYQAIARAINGARGIVVRPPSNVRFDVSDGLLGISHVTEELANVLAADNHRFDRVRFIEACETGKTKGMPR